MTTIETLRERSDGSRVARRQSLFGVGRALCHHGELLQGVFVVDGRLRRGLLTLPCDLYHADVRAKLVPGTEDVVKPAWRVRALRAARMTLDLIDLAHCGVRLEIESTVPVAHGFGSSTSDVSGAIRAVAAAAGTRLAPHEVASLAIGAEVASDGIWNGHPVLFAHREGVIIEEFAAHLPELEVVGFSTPHEQGPVHTLSLPPARYTPWEIESFRVLRGLMRRGLARRDPIEIGSVATASARLNQRHLPVTGFDALEGLVARVGAVGLQVAHSGDVAGVLFDRGDTDLSERVGEARRELVALGVETAWQFRIGGPHQENRHAAATSLDHVR